MTNHLNNGQSRTVVYFFPMRNHAQHASCSSWEVLAGSWTCLFHRPSASYLRYTRAGTHGCRVPTNTHRVAAADAALFIIMLWPRLDLLTLLCYKILRTCVYTKKVHSTSLGPPMPMPMPMLRMRLLQKLVDLLPIIIAAYSSSRCRIAAAAAFITIASYATALTAAMWLWYTAIVVFWGERAKNKKYYMIYSTRLIAIVVSTRASRCMRPFN